MKKLAILLSIIAAPAFGQVTNTVNISNSLLGPVTNVFTNTQVNVGEAIITGAVFNASVTNEFNPTFSPTNVINVGSTTVNNTNTFITTNIIAEGAVNITNVTQYLGDFTQTIITNLIDQFSGVNVFAPIVVETNVTGTWTIQLTTNYAVGLYTQTGNITSVVFSVDSTNDVALGEVLFAATTNSITWPTNGLTWAAGAAPTLTTGQWSIIYFRAWRDDVHAVYVGDTP